MSLFKSTVPAGPPTVDEVFNGAQASSAYAKSVFVDAVEELGSANAALDEVVDRTTAEIDRLTDLRDQAMADQGANSTAIQRLQALIG